MKRIFVACGLVLALAAGAVAAGMETIELTGGARISGRILDRRSDRLVVDLGFRVVEIPMDAVERITEDGAPPAVDSYSVDLYGIRPGLEEATVKENIGRVAEAVVQVRTPTGLGSGFVIHPDGYVVTNQHVIAGEHEITVTLFKERENELENLQLTTVRIVAFSPEMDLALLKVEADPPLSFTTVPLAAESNLRQGQTVFAVGSPLGLDRSVSTGIVSLTNRVIAGNLYIQTTTEINPGNSGGPLFNLRGEVVGITNLKLAGIGLEGLNFAIPVSTLKEFLKNRNAFAYDPRNPNAGFRYNRPPSLAGATDSTEEGR